MFDWLKIRRSFRRDLTTLQGKELRAISGGTGEQDRHGYRHDSVMSWIPKIRSGPGRDSTQSIGGSKDFDPSPSSRAELEEAFSPQASTVGTSSGPGWVYSMRQMAIGEPSVI